MTEPLGIALIGCGTVGSGVARLLMEQSERLAARAARPLLLRRVVVRNPDKEQFTIDNGLLTANGKLRRDLIAAELKSEIDELYAARQAS